MDNETFAGWGAFVGGIGYAIVSAAGPAARAAGVGLPSLGGSPVADAAIGTAVAAGGIVAIVAGGISRKK